MSGRPRLVYDPEILGYDFGPGHPMAPHRIALTVELAKAFGVLEAYDVEPPEPIDDDALLRVHTPEYVAAVRAAGADPGHSHGTRFGIDAVDTPAFGHMHEASRLIAAASIDAAHSIRDGRTRHAVNIAGGLHHAMPGRASGFCVYNDAALGIAAMLDGGVERVAYVDIDAHHGDGVETVFRDDPRVLTISLHESPSTLFPGTGRVDDIGGAPALGSAVNVPLPAGTGDREWWRAYTAIVPPLLEAFGPEVLVSQHGADGHALDPLTHLQLSVDGQRAAAVSLHDLAHQRCDGRWLALGGGGYATVDVVPRTWTHVLAIAAGAPIDPLAEVPQSWRDLVRDRFGRAAPASMTDGEPAVVDAVRPFVEGYDPADPIDQILLRVQRAVFPYHGLDVSW